MRGSSVGALHPLDLAAEHGAVARGPVIRDKPVGAPRRRRQPGQNQDSAQRADDGERRGKLAQVIEVRAFEQPARQLGVQAASAFGVAPGEVEDHHQRRLLRTMPAVERIQQKHRIRGELAVHPELNEAGPGRRVENLGLDGHAVGVSRTAASKRGSRARPATTNVRVGIAMSTRSIGVSRPVE